MKIIFSTDQIYLHGGIEKVLAEKANYFADICGYEVIVLTNEQKKQAPCYAISAKIQLLDLAINYNRKKSYFSWANLQKLPNHIYQLNNILHELQPDVVIVSNFGYETYLIPFLYKKAKKIKEFHSSRYFESQLRKQNVSFLKKSYNQFNDWIESKYHYLIVLNQDEVSYYNSDNVVVIPNPVSIPKGTASLTNKKVIAAGRIAPVKGFDKLIQAWKKVHAVVPEWELHFFGEDYLETQKQLEILIKEYNLEKVIFFKGTSSNMVQTFTDYSLYVMSSVTECFPMVLLEALSVGLPVVSFDCPHGPRNIITNNEDGVLVENQSIEDLTEKILFLIENENNRVAFGIQAKRNSFKFSTPVVMQHWIDVLNS
ncbi:glycosyltransferase family 4 protein [Flavobacterium sp. FZUC8N2.13]|uniref:Glycosyltransferase family 4 protein n=1 Tax=Flavobacterium zubiriense TaxID=3138075 RepID=A0ABV4T9A4_9FLAO